MNTFENDGRFAQASMCQHIEQYGHHLTDILKYIFFQENIFVLVKISLDFVFTDSVDSRYWFR